ncbi:hypothetical protein PAN31117_05416 [Pandoraea anapnoica]|uniref:Uncharacterized protein n=1 Tax=Pandoraea anapnoica TaxID=2508301 RepID=A0A5E5ATZ8_9BURK|nr:hypothetical protein PAN31117_05416 [Pandoraea anapnoica]
MQSSSKSSKYGMSMIHSRTSSVSFCSAAVAFFGGWMS